DTGAGDFSKLPPRALPGSGGERRRVDQAVATLLARIRQATLPDELGFSPPAADEASLRRTRQESRRLLVAIRHIIRVEKGVPADREHFSVLRTRAEHLAIDVNQLARELSNRTTASTA